MTSADLLADSPPRRRTRWQVPSDVTTAIGLLVVLTVGVYVPTALYPDYQQRFGFSDLVLIGLYATVTIVCAPALLLLGPAADALGHRFVMRTSILLAAAGALCFLLADGPQWLLAARAAQGLSLAAATGSGAALIVERAPVSRKAWASIITTAAFAGGVAAGNLVAGVAVAYAPFPRQLPYVLLLALLAVGWRRVSSVTSLVVVPIRQWRPVRPGVPRAIRPPFVLAAATGSVAWATMSLFLSIIPALLIRCAGVTNPATIGAVLAAMVLCSMLTQPLVVTTPPRCLQLIGLGALLAGLVGLGLTGGRELGPTLACAIVSGLGHGMAYGGATAAVDDLTSPQDRGAVNAAMYLCFYLATGVPPVLVGVMTSWIPLATALSWSSWVVVPVAAATMVAVVPLTRTSRAAVG